LKNHRFIELLSIGNKPNILLSEMETILKMIIGSFPCEKQILCGQCIYENNKDVTIFEDVNHRYCKIHGPQLSLDFIQDKNKKIY
jgi:hypothetical protein